MSEFFSVMWTTIRVLLLVVIGIAAMVYLVNETSGGGSVSLNEPLAIGTVPAGRSLAEELLFLQSESWRQCHEINSLYNSVEGFHPVPPASRDCRLIYAAPTAMP